MITQETAQTNPNKIPFWWYCEWDMSYRCVWISRPTGVFELTWCLTGVCESVALLGCLSSPDVLQVCVNQSPYWGVWAHLMSYRCVWISRPTGVFKLTWCLTGVCESVALLGCLSSPDVLQVSVNQSPYWGVWAHLMSYRCVWISRPTGVFELTWCLTSVCESVTLLGCLSWLDVLQVCVNQSPYWGVWADLMSYRCVWISRPTGVSELTWCLTGECESVTLLGCLSSPDVLQVCVNQSPYWGVWAHLVSYRCVWISRPTGVFELTWCLTGVCESVALLGCLSSPGVLQVCVNQSPYWGVWAHLVSYKCVWISRPTGVFELTWCLTGVCESVALLGCLSSPGVLQVCVNQSPYWGVWAHLMSYRCVWISHPTGVFELTGCLTGVCESVALLGCLSSPGVLQVCVNQSPYWGVWAHLVSYRCVWISRPTGVFELTWCLTGVCESVALLGCLSSPDVLQVCVNQSPYWGVWAHLMSYRCVWISRPTGVFELTWCLTGVCESVALLGCLSSPDVLQVCVNQSPYWGVWAHLVSYRCVWISRPTGVFELTWCLTGVCESVALLGCLSSPDVLQVCVNQSPYWGVWAHLMSYRCVWISRPTGVSELTWCLTGVCESVALLGRLSSPDVLQVCVNQLPYWGVWAHLVSYRCVWISRPTGVFELTWCLTGVCESVTLLGCLSSPDVLQVCVNQSPYWGVWADLMSYRCVWISRPTGVFELTWCLTGVCVNQSPYWGVWAHLMSYRCVCESVALLGCLSSPDVLQVCVNQSPYWVVWADLMSYRCVWISRPTGVFELTWWCWGRHLHSGWEAGVWTVGWGAWEGSWWECSHQPRVDSTTHQHWLLLSYTRATRKFHIISRLPNCLPLIKSRPKPSTAEHETVAPNTHYKPPLQYLGVWNGSRSDTLSLGGQWSVVCHSEFPQAKNWMLLMPVTYFFKLRVPCVSCHFRLSSWF